MKWAKAYGSPSWAAAEALHMLEPSSHTSGAPGISGETLIRLKGCLAGKL